MFINKIKIVFFDLIVSYKIKEPSEYPTSVVILSLLSTAVLLI